MTCDDKQLLDRFLRDDDGLHAVTALKHYPRDFSHKQIVTEIKNGISRLNFLVATEPLVVSAYT